MKHMKLGIVLTAGLIISGITAGPKMERAKEFAKVGFHLAEVAVGALFIRHGIHRPRVHFRFEEEENHSSPLRRYGSLGIGTVCIAKGLYDLKVDLHRHMFAHLNAWWNYKTQQKGAEVETEEA